MLLSEIQLVQLQHLDRHEDSCGFTPVVCTNERCGATVNKRDLIHHESKQCEYRKLKCHSCEEMKITLANIEKKIATINKNVEGMETKIGRRIADAKADVEEKLGTVNNEVKELKTTLVESFEKVNDVLVKMENRIKENTRKIRNTSSGDKDKIFVAGDYNIRNISEIRIDDPYV